MRTTLRALLPRVSPSRFGPLAQCHRSHSSNSDATSVDPDEVSHFNALAAEWWDPHGSSRLLHLMNPLRLQFLQSCLLRGSLAPSGAYPIAAAVQVKEKPRRLSYLDVGCGGGILAESLARLRSTESVVGIDPSPEVLRVAVEHMRRDPALRGKLRYLNTTIDGLEEALAMGITGAEDDEGAAEEQRGEGLFDVVSSLPTGSVCVWLSGGTEDCHSGHGDGGC